MTDPLEEFLRKNYPIVIKKGDNYVAIAPMIFTTAILSECHFSGYGDRWCYERPTEAMLALARWSGAPGSEPEGWVRHPPTGRRRPGGRWEEEYINR